jgi:hypothetical protein
MESMVTRSVNDIPAAEKQAIESLLGRSLSPDQQVFVMAFTLDEAPDPAEREVAKQGLQHTFTAIDEHVAIGGVSAEEADAAVDEAMRHVRPRYP